MTIQVTTAVAIAELPPQDGGEGAWEVRRVVTSDLILEHAGIAAKDSAKHKPAQKAARLIESQVDETCFRRSQRARREYGWAKQRKRQKRENRKMARLKDADLCI
jgi:hypothetical protein